MYGAPSLRPESSKTRLSHSTVELIPIAGLPLVQAGDSLADLIVGACDLRAGDTLVVAQKIVSKSEGRVVSLATVHPSARALELAHRTEKDPRIVELILQETREVLRARPGVLIVEDRRGFVCANAGIDRSNIEQRVGEEVALLPLDPDASARGLSEHVRELTGISVPVIINDSHGRAWREGTVGVAIGVSGMSGIWDRRGDTDLTGYRLEHTLIGIADEMAAAASLLMGPADEGVPVVVVRGARIPSGSGSAREIQRPRERDLFR